MNKLVVEVGLPGSGKTEYAKSLAKRGFKVHSSDDMRVALTGDVNNQECNAEVFQKLHEEIRKDLKAGYNVVYDACNIHSKRRIAFLNSLYGIDCIKEAHVIATPYDIVLEQNRNRDKVVPQENVEHMYKTWQTPAEWEGFDKVVLLAQMPGAEYSVSDYDYYNQNNPHHQFTLGQHMRNVAEYVQLKTDDPLMYEAAIRHDAGKPFCEFKDEDGISHYYGHENVAAYDVLTDWEYDDEDVLELSRLINYHMYPKNWVESKTRERYLRLWGTEFFNKIMLLHEADVA